MGRGAGPSNAGSAAIAASRLANVSEYRSCCAEGYGDDDIDHLLDNLSEQLGLDLCCIWEYFDDCGFGGDSELFTMVDGQVRTLPEGLWEFLLDGAGNGLIDPATGGQQPQDPVGPIEYSSGRNLALENRLDEDEDEPDADGPVDLAGYRSRFADGWTSDDIDRELPHISAWLGLELRCVWEYRDQRSYGGHSDLIAVVDGQARELPDGLWDLLVEGQGDGPIDPSTVGTRPHPDGYGDLSQLKGSGHNLVLETRSA